MARIFIITDKRGQVMHVTSDDATAHAYFAEIRSLPYNKDKPYEVRNEAAVYGNSVQSMTIFRSPDADEWGRYKLTTVFV